MGEPAHAGRSSGQRILAEPLTPAACERYAVTPSGSAIMDTAGDTSSSVIFQCGGPLAGPAAFHMNLRRHAGSGCLTRFFTEFRVFYAEFSEEYAESLAGRRQRSGVGSIST